MRLFAKMQKLSSQLSKSPLTNVAVENFQKEAQKGDFPKNSPQKRAFYCKKGAHYRKHMCLYSSALKSYP